MVVVPLLLQAASTPDITVVGNKLKKLHFSFERFVENRIREKFPFTGTPIIIRQRVKGGREERE